MMMMMMRYRYFAFLFVAELAVVLAAGMDRGDEYSQNGAKKKL